MVDYKKMKKPQPNIENKKKTQSYLNCNFKLA